MSFKQYASNDLNSGKIQPVGSRLLIVTAVDAERDAILRGVAKAPASRIDVIAAG